MRLRKLASNAAYLTLDWLSITILSSLFWIIAGKLLSTAELGIVSTAFNLAVTIQFFTTLGIGVALSKLISEYDQNKKENEIAKVSRPAIKILLASNILMVIVLYAFAGNFSTFFKFESSVILVTAILAVLLSLTNVAGYVLLGFQAMKKFMMTNLFFHIAKVVSSAIFVFLGFSFFGPLAGLIAGLTLLLLARFDIFNILKSRVKVKENYRGVLKYSIPALVGGLSVIVFNNVPYITLTVLQDLSITGIFTPALLLATPLFVFPNAFNSALFPIISGLSGRSSGSKDRDSLINTTIRYAIFLTLPLALFMILFSEQIIQILFTPEYLPAAQLLKILSIAALIQGLSGILLGTIYALKKPHVQQNILISISTLFIILSLPLTKYFSAAGMSAAYFVSAALLFALSYLYLRRMINLDLPYKDLSKIAIASIAVALFVLATKPLIQNLYSIFFVIPGILIYFFSLYFLNFYNPLDLKLVGFLSNRAPGILSKPLNIIYNLLKSKVES